MSGVLRAAAAASLLVSAACETVSPPSPPPPRAQQPEPAPAVAPAPPPAPAPLPKLYREEGRASWYGAPHHGQKTASGEIFDKDGFTAAHRTLPFDTPLRVINLENGRTVEVIVTDRGPYVDGRVIDLSEAAARSLGFAEDGLARVRIEELPQLSGAAPQKPHKPASVE